MPRGGFPIQGRATDHGKADPAAIGNDLGLPIDGDTGARSGVRIDVGVCYE